MADEPAPKVFISYSWTSDAHGNWVEKLATRLRADAVDAVFDRWDLKRGHDKFAFMESMVTDPTVKKVLAVCDAEYAAKADGRKGGVGTETQIISPNVYAKAQQEKFIPIVRERDADGEACLPTFFKQTIYLDFSDDASFEEVYDELLRDIFDAPAKPKPPIGKRPSHLFASSPVQIKTSSALLRLKNAIETQKPFAPALLDDYFDIFIDSLEDFRISCKEENASTFDDVVAESIEQLRSYRDNFVECILFVLKFAPGPATQQSITTFLEKLIPFQKRPEFSTGYSEVDFDNYRFFASELFLYLIAACLRTKQYDSAAAIIESPYHVTTTLGGNDYYTSSPIEFNEHVRSFDQIRNQRLKLNLISVSASLMQSRAPSGPISFGEVIQADCLLFLRGSFPRHGHFSHWNPRCLPYAERLGTSELFARATTDKGLEPLKTLLRVRNRDELIDGLVEAMKHGNRNLQFRMNFVLQRYLNYSDLNCIAGRVVEGP